MAKPRVPEEMVEALWWGYTVALALACTIWSNDRELKEKQSRVTVHSTAELIALGS